MTILLYESNLFDRLLSMQLDIEQVFTFREIVWDYYRHAGRQMPWRDNPEPYWVMVSELMLQQTQVGRVLPKFQEFIRLFPSVEALAAASLPDVLRAWNGLGYNRRAKFLHAAAQQIVREHGGHVPQNLGQLVALPGIGPNTAGAIMAYAYDRPVIFIETNIRTVYFHHFFADQDNIDDKALRPLIEQTLDHEHPRQWYWALMDYGTHLKQTAGNNIRRSKHYAKQSAFAGSRRQVRGEIIRQLLQAARPVEALLVEIADDRSQSILDELIAEGFVQIAAGVACLTDGPVVADNNR